MPPAPEPHAIAMLVLTGVALVLFTRKRFPLEISSLILIVLLTMGFALFPYEKNGDQGSGRSGPEPVRSSVSSRQSSSPRAAT